MAKSVDLASVLAEAINKQNKEGTSAYFLTDPDVPTNVSDWISTGNTILDVAISNRPYGGIPVGRIITLEGLEQTGKSLLCAHILAETQKKNGVAVLLDTENSVSMEFYDAIGLDVSKMLYVQADTVEEIFTYIETIIEKVRKSDKDIPITIAVDSVANVSTKSEVSGDYNKEGYATDKSIILGRAMRKITNMIGEQKITLIFTNQLRMKMNAMPFQDPWTSPGGKALPYASSVIIRLVRVGMIKDKDKKVIGVKIKAELKKNRVGPPFTSAEFDIYFESGIDNYGSWLKVLKDNKIVNTGGAWTTYTDDNGEDHKFQKDNFLDLIENDENLKDELYRKICDTIITTYRKNVVDPEDIIVETEDETGV